VRATVESVTVLPSRTLVTVDPVHAHGSATGDTVGGTASGDTVVATFDGDFDGDGRPAVGGAPAPGDVVALRLVAGQVCVITAESVREVAAGAIVDGGRVLVARRS